MKLNYLIIPVLVLAVAVLGSWFTNLGMDWYNASNLPSFAPAGAIIGLVWTIIFILSAIVIIRWWNAKRDKSFHLVTSLLVINGLLNALWCYLFFTLHLVGASIIEMLVLELTVLALIGLLWKKHRVSAILFIPYGVWVIFASFLAWSFYLLN